MTNGRSSLLPEQFGPLQGLRILSSGTIVAEPFAAELAAEMGAEVIHIERPQVGDHLWRTAEFPVADRENRPVSISAANSARVRATAAFTCEESLTSQGT